MNYASLGQQAVWLVLAIVSYAWVCRWIGRKLEETERELEASQLRIAHLRTDLAIAEYLDGLNQHRVREWDENAFALDTPKDAA